MNSSPESRGLDSSLEERIQREADKLGSVALAKIRLGLDLDPDDSIEEPKKPQALKEPKFRQPRVSTRGGKSHNEGSDSEHDPNWSGPRLRLTKEQMEINQRGRRLAREAQAARTKSTREDVRYDQPVLPVFSHQAQVDASWDAIEAEIERNKR